MPSSHRNQCTHHCQQIVSFAFILFASYIIPPFATVQYPSPVTYYTINMLMTFFQVIHQNRKSFNIANHKLSEAQKTADTTLPNNILGMLWNPMSKQLSLVPKSTLTLESSLTTKRELLLKSSKVFDPIGIAVPVTTSKPSYWFRSYNTLSGMNL